MYWKEIMTPLKAAEGRGHGPESRLSITRRNFHRLLGTATAWAPFVFEATESRAQMVSAPLQPFAAQVRRVISALEHIGEPLNPAARAALESAFSEQDEATAVAAIQRVLDRHVLLKVNINPESRV